MTPWVTTCTLTRRGRATARDSQSIHSRIRTDLGRQLWAMPAPGTLVVQHAEPVIWPRAMPDLIGATHTVRSPDVAVGDRVRFALIANPTHAPIFVGAKRGVRQPLPPGRWDEWVTHKLSPALKFDHLTHQALSTTGGQRQGARVVHRRVCFTGTATVADADQLAAVRNAGVGAGKAYGCGLLLVRPL